MANDSITGRDVRIAVNSLGDIRLGPTATSRVWVERGDINTIPWTDYSGTSTIVGIQEAGNSHDIRYKRVGKTVFVNYRLAGTSDDTVLTFTLPYTATAGVDAFQAPTAYIMDNSVALVAPGRTRLPASSAIVTVYRTITSAAWTGANTKMAVGQFVYETA